MSSRSSRSLTMGAMPSVPVRAGRRHRGPARRDLFAWRHPVHNAGSRVAEELMARTGKGGADEAVVIKKYANRRLYDTAASSYVTLDHLARMVKDGIDFVVRDARTDEDITRSVLTQIIVEEEAKGTHLLPVGFLRQLIAFYGDSLQTFVPRYLEMSMDNLARNQERVRDGMAGAFGRMFPFAAAEPAAVVEELVKTNMAMAESALEMFRPASGREREAAAARPPGETASREELDALNGRIEELQRRLDELTGRGT